MGAGKCVAPCAYLGTNPTDELIPDCVIRQQSRIRPRRIFGKSSPTLWELSSFVLLAKEVSGAIGVRPATSAWSIQIWLV